MPRYSLRTLLIVLTFFAASLAAWRRVHECRRLAHEHHYSALLAGYTALTVQGLVREHLYTEPRGFYTAFKEHASSFDRVTMSTAYPYWEDSIRHSQLADHYVQVTKKPWIAILPPPKVSSPPPLPTEDAELRAWWEKHVANHIAYNGLDYGWGSYSEATAAVNDRNIAFLNIHPDSFHRFLALTSPELFEEGDYLRPKRPAASR